MEQLLDGAGPLPVLFSVSDDRWRETMQTELLAAPDIELPADGWQPWIRRTA